MSTEEDKLKHSKRQQQKENHINRQMSIRKAHSTPDYGTPTLGESESPHRYHKVSGMTCGDSNCVMCGNPRKFFDEPTQQEKRLTQDLDNVRSRHSNGLLSTGTDDE
jgi:hypothetical protein